MGASSIAKGNDKNRHRYRNVTSQISLTKPTPARNRSTYATELDIDMLAQPEIPDIEISDIEIPDVESDGQVGVDASESRVMTRDGVTRSYRNKKPRDREKLRDPLRPRGLARLTKRQSKYTRSKRKPRANYTHITSQDGSAMPTPSGITDDCNIEPDAATILEPMIPDIGSDELLHLGTSSSAGRAPESPRDSPFMLTSRLDSDDGLREKTPTAPQSPMTPPRVPAETKFSGTKVGVGGAGDGISVPPAPNPMEGSSNNAQEQISPNLPEKNPRRLNRVLPPDFQILPSQLISEQTKVTSALSAEPVPERSHSFGESIRTISQTDPVDANGPHFDSDDANAPIPDISEDIDESWSGFRDGPDMGSEEEL
ncbi:hypothetical protein HIM_09211 [Hirsutella minnesotensis 3608]|uniref:Uncharacterized protein n=1 Tax=Hirsutella minnesotensis 3608 TaxID=1043627 RepID=A0A0F7ZSI5_9HYPO|nr:hypothetical protein HIM_09211 [Hirsutella minnesotensis 3608]